MAWVPLESNPEVMTKFLHKLGVPNKWGIVDVYGVDPDLLAVVPRPVLAIILLYPITEKSDEFKNGREAKLKETGQDLSKNIYYLKQCVSNACGTVALIHSVANNSDNIQLEEGHLKTFLDVTMELSPLDRGELLVNSQGIIDTHKELAQEGQTEAPGEDSPVIHHFVAFIQKDGSLYELDGRQSIPVNHGPSSPETFLEDAARVCQEYMARDPNEPISHLSRIRDSPVVGQQKLGLGEVQLEHSIHTRYIGILVRHLWSTTDENDGQGDVNKWTVKVI